MSRFQMPNDSRPTKKNVLKKNCSVHEEGTDLQTITKSKWHYHETDTRRWACIFKFRDARAPAERRREAGIAEEGPPKKAVGGGGRELHPLTTTSRLPYIKRSHYLQAYVKSAAFAGGRPRSATFGDPWWTEITTATALKPAEISRSADARQRHEANAVFSPDGCSGR
jgi:hypothetical protein